MSKVNDFKVEVLKNVWDFIQKNDINSAVNYLKLNANKSASEAQEVYMDMDIIAKRCKDFDAFKELMTITSPIKLNTMEMQSLSGGAATNTWCGSSGIAAEMKTKQNRVRAQQGLPLIAPTNTVAPKKK